MELINTNKSDNPNIEYSVNVANLMMEKLKRTENNFRDLFFYLDDFRQKCEFWKDKDYLPYSYIHKLVRLMSYYKDFSCHTPNGNIRSTNKITSIAHALYTWRFAKKIYKFDEDLVNMLAYQDISNMEIYSDFIEKLPFNGMCIYVDNDDIAYFNNTAIVVVLDTYDHMYKCLSFYLFDINRLGDESTNKNTSNILEGCIDFTIPLINGKTLEECIEYFCAKHNIWKEYNISDYQSFITQIFNLLLYILSTNADITVENSMKYYHRKFCNEDCDQYDCDDSNEDNKDVVVHNKSNNKNNTKEDNDNYEILNVGVSVGNNIRLYREIKLSKNSKSKGHRSSSAIKYPYVRRGHYHKYYVGPRDAEERDFIIKWIAPTCVNGYCTNTEIVSVSPLTK